MMVDIVLIIINIACLIAFMFFIRATNRNTDARLQENEILKDLLKNMKKLQEGGWY